MTPKELFLSIVGYVIIFCGIFSVSAMFFVPKLENLPYGRNTGAITNLWLFLTLGIALGCGVAFWRWMTARAEKQERQEKEGMMFPIVMETSYDPGIMKIVS